MSVNSMKEMKQVYMCTRLCIKCNQDHVKFKPPMEY